MNYKQTNPTAIEVDNATGVAYVEGAGNEGFLVGFFPFPETEGKEGWIRHFAATAYAYKMDCQIVWEPEQITRPPSIPVVAIEEYQANPKAEPIQHFVHPHKATYIVGNSHHRFPSDFMGVNHSVYIETPGGFINPLYGSQALAIALHDRQTKLTPPPEFDINDVEIEVRKLHTADAAWFEQHHPDKCDLSSMWALAKLGDEIIGVAAMKERGKGVWHLKDGMVRPEYRRRGVFGKLWAARMDYLKKRKAKIATAVNNAGSAPFARRDGFEPMIWYPYSEQFEEFFFFKCL